MKTIKIVLGALFIALIPASSAFAQRDPTAGASAPAHHGSDRVAVARDDVTGGYRAPTWGDNSMGVIGLDTFVAQYRAVNPDGTPVTSESTRRQMAEAAFRGIQQQTIGECSEVGEWIRETFAIVAEVHANQLAVQEDASQIQPLLVELGRLRGTQRGVNLLDAGLTVFATAAYCAIPGVGTLGCAGVAAGSLGHLGQIFSGGKAQRLDRNMRELDLRQRETHSSMASTSNRALLNDARMRIGWARRFQAYCMIVAPNQTSGISVPVNSEMLRWNYGSQPQAATPANDNEAPRMVRRNQR